MQKVRSTLWIFIYMVIYPSLQLAYSIMIGFAFGIREGLAGRANEIEESAELLLGTQWMGAVILAGITSLILYYLIVRFRGKNFREECRFRYISASNIVASAATGVSTIAISGIIMGIIALLMESALLEHIENMKKIMGGNVWITFLSIGIVAPLIEEVIFRGLVFRELEKIMSIKSVIVVQGLLFGLYHMNITQGVYATAIGILLGLLLVWTKSIWVPIIVHIVNNSVSFGVSQIAGNEAALIGAGTIILIGLIAFPFLVKYFYKSRETVK